MNQSPYDAPCLASMPLLPHRLMLLPDSVLLPPTHLSWLPCHHAPSCCIASGSLRLSPRPPPPLPAASIHARSGQEAAELRAAREQLSKAHTDIRCALCARSQGHPHLCVCACVCVCVCVQVCVCMCACKCVGV